MTWKKRISIWIVVSLSLQCLVLFYIDHYFLATSDSKVVSKKIVEDKKEETKKIDITVPESAEKILASYDAKYLSYYEDRQLKIVNCKDGKVKDIEAKEGSEICFYKWLPDRNRMYLVEKNSNDESGKLVLYSYDLSKGEKSKVKDLAWVNAKSEVKDIQFSILTGFLYVNVASEGERSNIYRIKRMVSVVSEEKVTKVDTIPSKVSNIVLARHEDNLIYEGSVYNKIYAIGREEPITVEGVDKLTIIGIDNNDYVYLGELKDKLVSKIYYGKTADKTQDWKTIELQQPCERDDLFVSDAGKVYQHDSLQGVVKEINSGSQTSYEGKFLQMYAKGIVSLVGNKISFVPFK
ncbi:hypothetical protein [Clostridium tagluense]|uniref:hypothetical protein n=1 Tax=Clostridium tagluense TaxID=360422 RepID=UPI001C6F1BB3|nr:hypothetical protein [Clostridium tagluense]MBW9157060.1 hypothetical protein [Clostridium tagluense]WLC65042.1 hypothetical protein KTC93_19730 [Clostridium tagluense]